MKITFRTDFGTHIGSGHITRCMTLANELKRMGATVTFISRNHHGTNLALIKNSFNLHTIESGVNNPLSIKDADYESWLGTSLNKEIDELHQFQNKYGKSDLFIIDHYALDARYEKEVKSSKLLVIDDLMNRKHCSDYILDQNLSASKDKYKELLEGNGKLLLGPQYALLKNEFSMLRPKSPQVLNSVQNILVYFGAGDLTRECKKVIEASSTTSSNYSLKIILSSDHQDFSSLDKKIKLTSFEKNMAKAISESDICFGACGTTTWERACLAKPSFVVTTAANQKFNAESLQHGKYADFVGDGKQTSIDSWLEVFKKIENVDYLNQLAKNSFNLCDGKGVGRVISEISND